MQVTVGKLVNTYWLVRILYGFIHHIRLRNSHGRDHWGRSCIESPLVPEII
jgi:hypothetical protein